MRKIEYGVYGFIFSAGLSVSEIVPQIVGYIVTAGTFALLCFWLVKDEPIIISGPKPTIILFAVVCVGFIIPVIVHVSDDGIVRLVTYIIFTPFLVFTLPQRINFNRFWHYFALTTASVTLVGLPTLFVEKIAIGPITISAWYTSIDLVFMKINTLSSVFSNPNTLAAVCCFAIVGYVVSQPFTLKGGLLTSINTIGLLLSDGRAALLATVVGLLIYIAGYHNKKAVPAVSAVGLVTIGVSTLIVFRVLPGPDVVQQLSLSGRRVLWSAAVDAIRNWPVGYGTISTAEVLEPYITDQNRIGVDPHNSFLQVTLIGGVFSGISYLALHVHALFLSTRMQTDYHSQSASLLWASIILQMFTGSTIFGLSVISTVTALIIGFSIYDLKVHPRSGQFSRRPEDLGTSS